MPVFIPIAVFMGGDNGEFNAVYGSTIAISWTLRFSLKLELLMVFIYPE